MRAALIAAVAALALAVAGCGSSDEQNTVKGDDYSFTVPGGWSDVTKQAKSITASGTSPDTAVAGKRKGGFTPNVNTLIERVPSGTTPTAYALRARTALNRAGSVVSGTRIATPSKLDGERVATVQIEREQQGRTLRALQVYAIRNGRAYVITYTTLPRDLEAQAGSFQEVLNSWRWE
jgi:hypothetical protein